MPAPWLSVIMPVYNGESFLPRALESIAAQADPGVEVLALDDGSGDRSPEILKSWATRLPLRLSQSGRCGNWVAVTNRGLEMPAGESACFLHQDDAWLPDRLKAMRQVIASTPSGDFVVHATQYVDRQGRSLGRSHPLFREGP